MNTDSITQPMIVPRLDRRRFRIVAGIDLTEHAEIVLEHALDQAARHDAPDLHFITVRERSKQSVHELKSSLFQLVTTGVDSFGMGDGDWRARLHVRTGDPADEIALLATDILADLIVVGKFGSHEHRHGRIGSVADRVLASAPCPALVVGLTSHDVQHTPECPACAVIREQSQGDVIFCRSHRLDDVALDKRATLPARG